MRVLEDHNPELVGKWSLLMGRTIQPRVAKSPAVVVAMLCVQRPSKCPIIYREARIRTDILKRSRMDVNGDF